MFVLTMRRMMMMMYVKLKHVLPSALVYLNDEAGQLQAAVSLKWDWPIIFMQFFFDSVFWPGLRPYNHSDEVNSVIPHLSLQKSAFLYFGFYICLHVRDCSYLRCSSNVQFRDVLKY